jgi:hypothetical protein
MKSETKPARKIQTRIPRTITTVVVIGNPWPTIGRLAWTAAHGHSLLAADALSVTRGPSRPRYQATRRRLRAHDEVPARFRHSAVLFLELFGNGFRSDCDLSTYPLNGCNRRLGRVADGHFLVVTERM